MRNEFSENEIKWVNINNPDNNDIEYIKSLYAFHPLVIESIISPTLHPTIEEYENHLFLILHFPIIYKNEDRNEAMEVDFLITKNLLITITYHDYPKLNEIFEKFRTNKKIDNQSINTNTGKLVYSIIDLLLNSLINDLDFLEEQVTNIEDKIFEKHHPAIIEEISHARRDVLDFKRTISPIKTVASLLPTTMGKFYGKEIIPYFVDIITTESKIRHLIENHKETIDALYETNESLVSNRISKIMTILTIFSAIILPVNLLASLWGMNQQYMPLRDGPYDFWIVTGAMVIIVLTLITIFKKKHWL